MTPRRSDRELVEHLLEYLNSIKTISTEGELAAALSINSETANKWLELLILIKRNCPDFQYKKVGRYRIIDMVGLEGLAQEISQVDLKKFKAERYSTTRLQTRYRATRFGTLNNIHHDLRMITKMLIRRLQENNLSNWTTIVNDAVNVFEEVINVNLYLLASPEGKNEGFIEFKSSLQNSIEVFIKSIIDLEPNITVKPKLKLITLERDFTQKLSFIVQKFEESELKLGKKPDLFMKNHEVDPKAFRTSMLGEMKVKLDNLPNALQKPDLEKKKSKVEPFLKCFSCNLEQPFPIHCNQHMDYEDGVLICEICREKMTIPVCSKCNQILGIGIKKFVGD
jgi:hypothetical protein